MIFYFSHSLPSSHFSDSSLNLFSFLSHALSSLPFTVRILSQDRLWVAVVSDRRGSGFQIGVAVVSDRWPGASDRTARGFRSNLRVCDSGGRGAAVGLGFDGFLLAVAALSSASLSSSHQ